MVSLTRDLSGQILGAESIGGSFGVSLSSNPDVAPFVASFGL
jgi:hypothetical protein